jgi:peptide deformylase
LEIVNYPHPTLRHTSKPIKRVDAFLRAVVREMFELMYEARGVGLAANQVDLPIRLFIVNLAAEPDSGEEQVFINPVISRPKGLEQAEEGCLSLPELHAMVTRPKTIQINAFALDGNEINASLDGLFARVVQHETDHLDGVLFVDRLSEPGKLEVAPTLSEFDTDFASRRAAGGVPSDAAIAARLSEWEQRYCE